jgi:hypothetical protein
MDQHSSSWPSEPQNYALSVVKSEEADTDRSPFPSDESYLHAAEILEVHVNVIKAFAVVEGGAWGAFLPSGLPIILFERHLFHRYTGGKYDTAGVSNPSISPQNSLISSPVPGGYGSPYVQHIKLARAAELDRPAALKATSWGLFQILGVNHERAGFALLQAFINAMYRSADDHLLAFVGFIKSDLRLLKALQTKNWPVAEKLYNGPMAKGYAAKIQHEYARLSA